MRPASPQHISIALMIDSMVPPLRLPAVTSAGLGLGFSSPSPFLRSPVAADGAWPASASPS